MLSPSLLASVGVGLELLLTTTSSNTDAHDPLLTVQRKVALVPNGTPVTDVLKEEALVIVAVPPATVQSPLPMAGAVAFSVKLPLLHCEMSVPAAAALGGASLRTNNVACVDVQTPLLIVHCNTTSPVPATTPVMVVLGKFALVIVAVPLTILQVPVVPATAAFPAMVKVLLLHWMIFGPAFAALGATSTSMVMPALVPVQLAAELTTTLTTSPSAKAVVV
jgi:hypothetical protein